MSNSKTVIVIAGPTAVGKTALAIEVAKHFNTEIISADSRQCYKELNIGVARPSVKELAAVQHHFIASHAVTENINAAYFEEYALHKASLLFKQHNVIVMVGGTGLYINAFCYGLDNIPQTPQPIREQLNKEYQQNGLLWLQQTVQQKDPAFWQIAEKQNPHRLLRALEVIETTGKSITTFKTGTSKNRPFKIVKIALELNRQALYDRINTRVDVMMQEGLVEEVKALTDYQQLNALQTVGYKEIFSYLNNEINIEQAIAAIKQNTRHYAKRQLTWFRKDATFTWFNAADIKAVISFLQQTVAL